MANKTGSPITKKIILIVGLPGSGKTELARKMGGALLDDLSNNGGLEKIDVLVNTNEPLIIITDPHLCRTEAREFAIRFLSEHASEYIVEWIFFENNIEACRDNIQNRRVFGDLRIVETTLERLAKAYVVPDFGRVVPVWRACSCNYNKD